MNLPIHWIDAFTDRVFAGNPAAVVPLGNWLPDELMQRIARENGLSETAFLVRTGADLFHLRWFTPAQEIDLCGHATLAAAHVLFHALAQSGERVTFDTRSGLLTVTRLQDGLLQLDFPSRPGEPVAVTEELAAALGARPQVVYRARDYLCVFSSEAEVRSLQPDFTLLGRIETLGVIATAVGESCDFVSRFFAPRAGVPEDPVTGSAHCTLVPYWANRLGKVSLHARQVSDRGGELLCALSGDRVLMAGRCAAYLRGEICV